MSSWKNCKLLVCWQQWPASVDPIRLLDSCYMEENYYLRKAWQIETVGKVIYDPIFRQWYWLESSSGRRRDILREYWLRYSCNLYVQEAFQFEDHSFGAFDLGKPYFIKVGSVLLWLIDNFSEILNKGKFFDVNFLIKTKFLDIFYFDINKKFKI